MPDSAIRYWIEGNNEYPLYYSEDGQMNGLYAELIRQIEAQTGRVAELVTRYDDSVITAADAVDLLKRNELDMVLGLPKEALVEQPGGEAVTADGTAASGALHESGLVAPEVLNESGLVTSEVLYENSLVAVILPDKPQVPYELVENCYWAADAALIDMLTGTRLDGHTLDFNTRHDMFEALDSGSVYGVLIKKSAIDYEALTAHRIDYRQCESVAFDYSECVYLNASNKELNTVVNDICLQLKAETVNTHAIIEAGYTNNLANAYKAVNTFEIAAIAGIATAMVLAIVALVLKNRLKALRESTGQKFNSFMASDPDKELYELDIRKRTLYSYDDFRILGGRNGAEARTGSGIPNPVSLEELTKITGYDFVAHYAEVSPHSSLIYKNRMLMHAGGKKHFITEDGRRFGNTLFICMTELDR